MSISHFKHVRVVGVKTIIPERFIDIDDELQYFDSNPKKLARQKKMIGYGRRYIADEKTTVIDLACDAANKLLTEMQLDRSKIEMLIFVNQKPDYTEPCDANVAHGVLGLSKTCAALDINLGCSGYVYALWTAHSFISSGAVKNCLLLAGDLCAQVTDQTNRKVAPVFGDAASATFLEWVDEDRPATFVMGADGSGWNKIVYPFGGRRIPLREEDFALKVLDGLGNKWTPRDVIMKGEDVFKFTMDVAPQLIKDTLVASGWNLGDVGLFAIHQANKQILEMIIGSAGIPLDKAPTDVFSKYANNSTNSVVTVVCDQPKDRPLGKTVLCAFGIGLSWGGAAVDLTGVYNGGISTYVTPANAPGREEQINNWIKYFKGE